MNLKYNAFISYRHAEQDSKIASEVQTRLERFRIPKEIVKKTGVKRFERIFRDKEELPITSDLNDDIEMALANSDNLIVICSTRTNESVWVRKEIETFLKYHRKENIYTVLVDGDEPTAVIPDILQHNTVTVTLPDGRVETREEFIEPLSCDYRIGIKKARKVELPRLAASMLGVSYDEIVQRRKQYIRRRNSIIGCCAAVMLAAIIGYLTWSLLQIKMNYNLAQQNYQLAQSNLELAQANYEEAQTNYQESLRNQSRYLASESLELLYADDKVGAVQLALAALPSDGSDRPITGEAEYALTAAMGCYETPGMNYTTALWKYGTGYDIRKFRIDQINNRVALHDEEDNLLAWSLTDHTLLKNFNDEAGEVRDFIFDGAGHMIIVFTDRITAYDSDLNDALWILPLDDDHKSNTSGNLLIANNVTKELFYGDGNFLMIIDVETGNIKEDYLLNNTLTGVFGEEDTPLYITLFKFRISNDASKVALVCSVSFSDYRVVLFDREKGTWTQADLEADYIGEFKFSPDGKKLVVSYESDVFENSYTMYGMQVLKESVRHTELFDAVTGIMEWNVDTPHTLVGYASGLEFTKYGDADVVAVMFSNKCVFVETESGKVLDSREFPSEYIDCYVRDDDSAMNVVLRNGQYLYANLSDIDSSMSSRTLFSEHVEETLLFVPSDNNNHFLIQYSDNPYLIEYGRNTYDRSFSPVLGTGGSYVSDVIQSGQYLVTLNDEGSFCCCDMGSGNIAWTYSVPSNSDYNVDIIGKDEVGNIYYCDFNYISDNEPSGLKIYKLDIRDGSIKRLNIKPEVAYSFRGALVGNHIYFGYDDFSSKESLLCIYDLTSDETEEIIYSEGETVSLNRYNLCISPDEKFVILSSSDTDDPQMYIMNLETEDVTLLTSGEVSFATWSSDSSKYAVGTKWEAVVYDANSGDEIYKIKSKETEILDVCFTDNGLLILYDSGTLNLYDDSGSVINSLDAFMNVSLGAVFTDQDVSFDFHEGTMVLCCEDYASVIDMNEFKVRNLIRGFIGIDYSSEKYFIKVYSPNQYTGTFGYFNIMSIDDLITAGKNFLGEEEMSEEMRQRYGIG